MRDGGGYIMVRVRGDHGLDDLNVRVNVSAFQGYTY